VWIFRISRSQQWPQLQQDHGDQPPQGLRFESSGTEPSFCSRRGAGYPLFSRPRFFRGEICTSSFWGDSVSDIFDCTSSQPIFWFFFVFCLSSQLVACLQLVVDQLVSYKIPFICKSDPGNFREVLSCVIGQIFFIHQVFSNLSEEM
jgi:hypothetical protein